MADRSAASQSYPCAPAVTGNSITIAGVGTVTITGATYFFDNSINLVGISNAVGSSYLSAEDGLVFDTYNLQTALASASYASFSTGLSGLATSGGSLTVTSFGDSATFQACQQCAATGAPEPGSLGLVLAGAIPLAAGLLRRRKR
jgi:hypothetical protein